MTVLMGVSHPTRLCHHNTGPGQLLNLYCIGACIAFWCLPEIAFALELNVCFIAKSYKLTWQFPNGISRGFVEVDHDTGLFINDALLTATQLITTNLATCV